MVPLFSRFVVNYRWPWLSSHAASQQNPLGRDRQEKNQPIENQIRRGTQGTLSLLSQRSGGKKHGFCVEGILNVRRVYEVCILNSCLLTFFKPFYRSYVKSYKTIQVLIIWLPVGCCKSGTPMMFGETVVNWNYRCTFSVSLAWNFRGTFFAAKTKTKTNGDLARFPGRRRWFIWLSARAVIGWRNNVWLCGFPALFAPTTCFKTWLVHSMVSSCCDWSIYFSDLVFGCVWFNGTRWKSFLSTKLDWLFRYL